MNKYVVAFISLYDHDLQLKIVEANSELKAAYAYLTASSYHDPDDYDIDNYSNLEEFQTHLWDNEAVINVLQICDGDSWLPNLPELKVANQ